MYEENAPIITIIITIIFIIFFGSLSPVYSLFAQTVIKGKVIDASTKEPVEGATILIKKTGAAISTNMAGEFSINTNIGEPLIVTYVGFNNRQVVAAANATIEITPLDAQLNEVVVTALGIRKEVKRLGYSVQEVKGSALLKARESNPINRRVFISFPPGKYKVCPIN